MEKAIICDIDGCLIDSSFLLKEGKNKGLKDLALFEYFDKNLHRAKKLKGSKKYLNLILKGNRKIIFLTARSEKTRAITYTQLNIFPPLIARGFLLKMRPENNTQSSAKYKENVLKKIMKDFEIELAVDDELTNVEMYKRNGINAKLWK